MRPKLKDSRLYRYRAVSPDGFVVKGLTSATCEKNIYLDLHEKNLLLIQCRPTSFLLSRKLFNRNKVTPQELLDFCLQMQYLDQAGVPVLDALMDAKDTIPQMYWVIDDMINQIRKGKMLSEALALHQDVFPDIFCHIIYLSEQSGDISGGFKKLYDHISWNNQFKKDLVQNIRYPLIVLGFSLTLIWILAAWVVPQLKDLLLMSGSEIPLSSRLLLQTTTAVAEWGPFSFLVILIFVIVSIVARTLSTPFCKAFDRWLLKLPMIGDLCKGRDITIYLHSLKVSLSSGIDLLEALEYSSGGVRNTWLQSKMADMYSEIKDGKTLSRVFKEADIFDSSTIRLIQVGEITGQLHPLLNTLEAYQMRNSKRKMEKFLGYLQPILFALSGLVLLWVVLSIFYPMYDSVLDMTM